LDGIAVCTCLNGKRFDPTGQGPRESEDNLGGEISTAYTGDAGYGDPWRQIEVGGMQAGAFEGLIEGNDELVGIGAALLDAGDTWGDVIKDLRGSCKGNRKARGIASPVIYDEEVSLAGSNIEARHDRRLRGTPLHAAGLGLLASKPVFPYWAE
jgi:hypothetical protein